MHSACITCAARSSTRTRLEGAGAHVQRDGRAPRRRARRAARAAAHRSAGWRSAQPRRRARARAGSGSARGRSSSASRVMYGGSGMLPCGIEERDDLAGRRHTPEIALRDRGPRPHRPPSRCAGLRVWPCWRAAAPERHARPAGRSSRISTRPPEGLVPRSRAATTRVSLKTSRSPGCSSCGRSMNLRSSSAAAGAVEAQQPARRSLRPAASGRSAPEEGRSGSRRGARAAHVSRGHDTRPRKPQRAASGDGVRSSRKSRTPPVAATSMSWARRSRCTRSLTFSPGV